MAEIVLGAGLSHTPQLFTDPDHWGLRIEADIRNPAHAFRGRTLKWEELLALRAGEDLESQITLESKSSRLRASLQAIETITRVFEEARADIAVICGNDQREMFDADLCPALAIYTGTQIVNTPRTAEQRARLPNGISLADHGYMPQQTETYPGSPSLAIHLLDYATRAGFDVANVQRLQLQRTSTIVSGIPHAYGFVYRQIMRHGVLPSVPVVLNTFYPPNQPTARRCFEFGRQLGAALAAWQQPQRIAVFASGGLSHFVVDAEFDHSFLDVIAAGDVARLAAFGEAAYQAGTSECKNWIVAAGILSTTPLRMKVVDYQPLYRSPGGNGTGAGFALWR